MKQLQITKIRVLKLANGSARDLKDPVLLDDTIMVGDLNQYRETKLKEIQKQYGKNYFIDLVYREL